MMYINQDDIEQKIIELTKNGFYGTAIGIAKMRNIAVSESLRNIAKEQLIKSMKTYEITGDSKYIKEGAKKVIATLLTKVMISEEGTLESELKKMENLIHSFRTNANNPRAYGQKNVQDVMWDELYNQYQRALNEYKEIFTSF